MPIEVKRLCHTYLAGTAGEKAALKDIELNIEKGEFFGIIGHTGSGKSTLLQHMGGIMPPEAGTVIVDGYDFSDKKQRIEGRKKVGLVFQYPEYQLFEETVAKDIAFGPKNMKLEQEEIDRRVRRAMELVGLDWERFAEKSPFELSGGEKETTNNRMELTAAIKGLEALKEPCVVKLVTDSKYVADGIIKGWAESWQKNNWIKSDKKPALNSDLWERLLELLEKHEVKIEWVKGHAGHAENERCDRLAVEYYKNMKEM